MKVNKTATWLILGSCLAFAACQKSTPPAESPESATPPAESNAPASPPADDSSSMDQPAAPSGGESTGSENQSGQ
jgi:hypothetical protein